MKKTGTSTVNVMVMNRTVKFLSLEPEQRKALEPYWSFSHPKWKYVIRQFPGWDGMIRYLKHSKIPAGLFWATKPMIEEETNIRFRMVADLKRVQMSDPEGWVTASDKYEFQNECVRKMCKVLRFGGGLVVNATGTGKTWLCGQFFSRLENMACFVVDQLVLLKQAKKDLENVLGEEVGWIGDSEFEPRRITVATRQTMYKHRKDERFLLWTEGLNVLVIDEIHEQMNHSNFSVVEVIKPKAVFGLTATLQLKKKSVRTKAWALTGPVIYEYPLVQGQSEGVLTQGIGVQVLYRNQMTKKYQKMMGWSELYKQNIVENGERNQLVTDLIRALHGKGKYVIVLVTRVRHLKELSERLKGIPHRVVSGTYDGQTVTVRDRFLHKDKFEAGRVRVLLANAVFKKGVDIKRVDAIIDAAAGRNENDPLQKYGRGVRLHDEKDGLLYFDVNDWDEKNKDNWFWKGARYRTRALKRAGVELHKFWWELDGTEEELVERSERWLQQKLKGR